MILLVLAGLSLRNQRIQRLWVDVKSYVTQYYVDLFYDNEIHLKMTLKYICLHCVVFTWSVLIESRLPL